MIIPWRLSALLSALMVVTVTPAAAQVVVGISVHLAPPVLPIYVQPAMPAAGYLWTPGYWAYGDGGYFWVPGTWVQPPTVGVLWTPPYWGWNNGAYLWHGGYWGPHIGFYGGVNYGFGYGGVGYGGGFWANGSFSYNRSVNNFGGVAVTNVYNKTVVNNTTVNRVSFNGGAGGTTAQATPEERSAERETHTPPTAQQGQHEHAAAANPAMRLSANHGRPAIAATARPGEFAGEHAAAKGADRAEAAHASPERAHPAAAAHPQAPAHHEKDAAPPHEARHEEHH